jgi:hypothetical protein
MTVWSVDILHFSFSIFSLWQFSCIFLRVFLYFTIMIPFYNFFFVVTVHTFLLHTALLMFTLPFRNYGFVSL